MFRFSATVWTDPTGSLPYDTSLEVGESALGMGEQQQYSWDSVLCVECHRGEEYADQVDVFIKSVGMFVFEMAETRSGVRTMLLR